MEQTFSASQVTVGFHPDGYRIDKTASAMDRYTRWDILPGNHWCHCRPVCFHELPSQGWIPKDRFDWRRVPVEVESLFKELKP